MILTKERSDCAKGLLAVLIFVHHLSSRYNVFWPIEQEIFRVGLGSLGYLCVAAFFFLSGYGLMAQYLSRGKDYLDRIPRKILSLYLSFLVLFVLYLALGLLQGNTYSCESIVRGLTFAGYVVQYGWFIQTTLFLYAFFWFSYSFFDTGLFRAGAMGVFLVLYCVICWVWLKSSLWFESVPAFFVGIICCSKRVDGSFPFVGKAILIVTLFVGSYLYQLFQLGSDCMCLLIKMVSAILFALIVFLLSTRTNWKNKWITWLGKRYFEIYLVQGFAFSCVEMLNLRPLSFIVLSIVFTVMLSKLISYPMGFIRTKVYVQSVDQLR